MSARPLGIGLLAVALAGCVTTPRLLEARGTGLARCYRLPYEELWETLEASVRWVGLVIDRSNAEDGVLLARSYRPEVEDPEEMALDADQGERVALFVEGEGPDVWAVEVVSRAAFALDPTPRDWTLPVLEAIEDRLPDAATAPDEELAACVRVRGLREPEPGPYR